VALRQAGRARCSEGRHPATFVEVALVPGESTGPAQRGRGAPRLSDEDEVVVRAPIGEPPQCVAYYLPYSTVRRDLAVLGLPKWWRRMVCLGVSRLRSEGGISCSPSAPSSFHALFTCRTLCARSMSSTHGR